MEYQNIDQALAGLQYGTNARIDSAIAQEIISPGAPVMGYTGVDGAAYNLHQDQAVVTISVALITANVFAVTINGTVISVTYATSSDATMTALIAAINANAAMIAAGITATANSVSNILAFTLKAMGIDLTVTGAVTLGASQPTVTVAAGSWSTFLGVALFAQQGGRDYGAGQNLGTMPVNQIGGAAPYQIGNPINIMNFGRVWVPCSVAILGKETAYAIYASGSTQGQFTDVSTGNRAISCTFITTRNSQNLAVLEIRGIA